MFVIVLCAWIATVSGFASDSLELKKVLGPQEVKARKEISRRQVLLRVGDVLLPGDEIETSPAQVLVMEASDGSYWKLGKDSSLKMHERSKLGGGPRMLILNRGALFSVWKESRAEKMLSHKISSSKGVLGGNKATFLLETQKEEANLLVVEGDVFWGKDWDLKRRSTIRVKGGFGLSLIPLLDSENLPAKKSKKSKRVEKKKSSSKPIRHSKTEVDAKMRKYGLDEE